MVMEYKKIKVVIISNVNVMHIFVGNAFNILKNKKNVMIIYQKYVEVSLMIMPNEYLFSWF